MFSRYNGEHHDEEFQARNENEIMFWSSCWLVLGGFDRHYQATVHFPLTSAIDKSHHYQNKFSGMLRIKSRGRWVQRKNATLCAMQPYTKLQLFLQVIFILKADFLVCDFAKLVRFFWKQKIPNRKQLINCD